MDEKLLDAYLEDIAIDIYSDKDYIDLEAIKRSVKNIKLAVQVYEAKGSCGCLELTEEMEEMKTYIVKTFKGA